MNELFVKLNFLIPTLPRAEKSFAEALFENPEAVQRMTLAEIARETNSSEASIIRFCKRLGLHGYTELKQEVALAVEEKQEDRYEEDVVESTDDIRAIMNKVFQSNVQTLQNTMVMADEAKYLEAVEAMAKAKSIHFFGVGDAFAACQFAYMKFLRLGVRCSAHSDVMMQFMEANNLGPDDVALAVSYEGRSRNVNQALEIAKKRGATTICITKMNKSPLLKHVDIPLYISISDLSVWRERVTRRVGDQFILDVLYMGYIARKPDFSRLLKKSQLAIDSNKVK